RWCLSPGVNGDVTLWCLGATGETIVPSPNLDGATAAAILADSRTAVVGTYYGKVSFWDMPSGRYLSLANAFEPPIVDNHLSHHFRIRALLPIAGDKVLCGSGRSGIERLHIWDARTFQPTPISVDLSDKRRMIAIGLSQDGRSVIGVDPAGNVHA